MLTTPSFEAMARMQMRALGDDSLDLVIVAHPIGGINADALASRCAEAGPQGVRWLEAEITRRAEG